MPSSRLSFRTPSWRRKRYALVLTTLFAVGAYSAVAATAPVELQEVQRLLRAGRPIEAMRFIDDALRRDPVDSEWRFMRGLALTDLQRPTEAMKVYGRLIEEHPELPEPRNNLAVLYAQQGQFDKARATFEDAIRTSPVYAAAYDNLGDVQARLAASSYAQALQLPEAASAPPSPTLTQVRDLAPAPSAKVLLAQAGPAATTPKAVPAPTPQPTPQPSTAAAPAPASAASVAKPVAPAAPVVPAKSPAVVAPSAPAASAAAPKPAASAAPPPPTPNAASAAQAAPRVRDAVVRWADAWSRRDLDAYYAAYVPNYGGGKSPEAWKQDRRARIVGKNQIEVTVSGMVVEVDGDRAKVRFRQSYRSDKLSVESNKTLLFSRVGGQWLIARESAGS